MVAKGLDGVAMVQCMREVGGVTGMCYVARAIDESSAADAAAMSAISLIMNNIWMLL